MIGTSNCVYETPCGWCSKWDKKCDKIAEKPQLIDNIDKFVYMANCDHEWTIMTSNSTTGRIYRCNKCGATKTEPLINYFTMIQNYYHTKEEAEANRDKWIEFYKLDKVLEV